MISSALLCKPFLDSYTIHWVGASCRGLYSQSSWKAFSSSTGLSIKESLNLDTLSKHLAQLQKRVLELKGDIITKYIPRESRAVLEQELKRSLSQRDEAEALNKKLRLRYRYPCHICFVQVPLSYLLLLQEGSLQCPFCYLGCWQTCDWSLRNFMPHSPKHATCHATCEWQFAQFWERGIKFLKPQLCKSQLPAWGGIWNWRVKSSLLYSYTFPPHEIWKQQLGSWESPTRQGLLPWAPRNVRKRACS